MLGSQPAMNLALAEEIEYVRSTETLAVRLGGHRLITDAVLHL